MVIATFSVFHWKYPFCANLVQIIEIVTSSWNLVPTTIRICRIQWWLTFFLFLGGNALFGQNWPKKSKLSVEAEISKLDYFEYAELNDTVHFFSFGVEIPFLGKFGPRNENCHFKLKFGTYTNLNIQNSMVMFIFFLFVCFWLEIPFLGKFCPKSQYYQLKLKLGTYTNSNMQN